jgi:hypothetical protein
MLPLGFARGLRALPFIFCVSLVFASPPAPAETQLQAAKRLYQAASHHYDLQEFEKALDEFKQAYEAKDDPVFLFNIAQCQRSLGQNEPALRSYKTYLLRAPNAPNRSDVATRIATLEAEIAQAKSEHAKPEPAKPEPTKPEPTKPEPTKPEPTKPEVATTTPTTPTTENPTTPGVDTSTPPATVLVETPPPRKPVYKRWWLWTVVGAVVVGAGLGVGLGLGLSHPHGQPVGPLVSFQ